MRPIAINLNAENERHYVAFKFGDDRFSGLLQQYYQLRKKVFVDELNWDVYFRDDVQIDRYDCEGTHYVLVTEGGNCVGGCRLVSVASRFSRGGTSYSYSLLDAPSTRRDSRPGKIFDRLLRDTGTWDMSKTIAGSNGSDFRVLLDKVRMHLLNEHAERLLFLARPAVKNLCESWGFSSLGSGQDVTIDGTTYTAAVFRI